MTNLSDLTLVPSIVEEESKDQDEEYNQGYSPWMVVQPRNRSSGKVSKPPVSRDGSGDNFPNGRKVTGIEKDTREANSCTKQISMQIEQGIIGHIN